MTSLKKKTKINKDVLDENGIRLCGTLPRKNLETKIKKKTEADFPYEMKGDW